MVVYVHKFKEILLMLEGVGEFEVRIAGLLRPGRETHHSKLAPNNSAYYANWFTNLNIDAGTLS